MNNNDTNKPLIAGNDSAISVKELHNAVDNHTDSHDMVSNTTNNNTVNQNSTVVYNGSAATEKLLSERKDSYLRFCKKNIVSPVISRQTRLELDEEAIRLQLDKFMAEEVEKSVIRRLNSSGKLSKNDQISLSIAVDKIKEDSGADMIDKLVTLSDRSEDEEVQFYANLSLAAYDFRRCIQRYEQRSFDSYWQTFWTYLAYKRAGNNSKAEATLTHLSNWSDYPDDQVTLLSGSGCLFDYFANKGSDSLKSTAIGYLKQCVSCSKLLSDYISALSYLTAAKRPLSFSEEKSINIYLRIFGASNKRQNVMNSTQNLQTFVTTPIGNSKPEYSAQRQESNRSNNSSPKTNEDNNGAASLNHKSYSTVSPSSSNYTQPKYSEEEADNKNWLKYAILGLIAIIALYFVFKPSKDDNGNGLKQEEVTITGDGSTLENPYSGPTSEGQGDTDSEEPKGPTVVTDNPGKETDDPHTYPEGPEPIVDEGPTEPQPQKSMLEQQLEAYNQGSTTAAVKLGKMYKDGDGVKKSYPKAFKYFKEAAEKGDAEGMYWLGYCYRNGNGTSKDTEQAEHWWRQAADAGNSKAKEAVKEFNTLM